MQHFVDRSAFEQIGKQVVPVIVATEVKIHILVYSQQFVGHGFVQQFDAFFFFTHNQ